MPAKVAIITRTTANRPILLKRAIASVLSQSFTDWVHVIVNDGGSESALKKVIEPFLGGYGDRLKVVQQEHQGMQPASNNGIQQSDSTYISIHDDDDAWDAQFLEKLVAFLESKGPSSSYQGVISQTVKILEEEGPDGSLSELDRSPYMPLSEISVFRIGYENPFPPIAFLYRRSAHDELGLFDPQWDAAADLDFNFRFLQKFNIGVVPEVLAHYHWRTESAKAESANTVTKGKDYHATLLTELKNHYLRKSDSAQSAAFGLAFLISHYAVENQWMTAETRDVSIQTLELLKAFKEKFLQVISDDVLKNELIEQVSSIIGESCIPQVELTHSINALFQLLKEDKAHTEEALSALDRGIKGLFEKLPIVTKGNERLEKRLEELGNSLSSGLETVHDFQKTEILGRARTILDVLGDLPDQLKNEISPLKDTLQQPIDEVIFPKLNLLIEQVAEQGRKQDSLINELISQKAAGEKYQLNLTHKMDALLKSLEAEGQRQHDATRAEMKQIKSQMDALEEELNSGFKLGPIVIRWRKKKAHPSETDIPND